MNFKRVLVLAPHTDDGELGCGGTIAKFCEQQMDVFYVAFSAAEESVPPGFPSDTLRREVQEATRVLGISPDKLLVLNYKVRELEYHRQKVLDDIIRFRHDIDPDLILIPTLDDLHQDHQVVANEAIRAFKHKSVLGYELPWNSITFNARAFVPLDEQQLNKKISALKCYETQAHRPYVSEEFIRSEARVRGVQIGVKWAEAFDVMRFMLG